MRLFIAVTLSEPMRKALTETMHELKQRGVRGRYTPVENLHMTLCFIGESRELPRIVETMDKVVFEAFSLQLSELGSFGDLLWVGLRGDEKLYAPVRALRRELDEAGISYDRKKFRPHITLIRKTLGDIGKISPPSAEMRVTKISLMRSDRQNNQMVYTEIHSIETSKGKES